MSGVFFFHVVAGRDGDETVTIADSTGLEGRWDDILGT